MEGFETTTQDVFSQVDDLNSINTLANIARKLIDGGLKIPGNIAIDGNLSVGGKVTGNFAVDGILTVGSRGMRLFSMPNLSDNTAIPVKDPEGNQYKWSEWVCCVQGLRMFAQASGDPGSQTGIYQFCYKKDDLWYIRSEWFNRADGGAPVILAIPRNFFDKVWEPPLLDRYMGSW